MEIHRTHVRITTQRPSGRIYRISRRVYRLGLDRVGVDSLSVNGQRKQAVEQIDRYGVEEFWTDYRDYLAELYAIKHERFTDKWFSDAVISYHRIKAAQK